MSVLRLLMMAAYAPAIFIARTSFPPGTSFSLPTSGDGGLVLPGDFLVIEYHDGATLSGGAGSAFVTTTFANTKVSSRLVEAGDLTTPFAFSANSPVVVMIVRGPTSLGPAVRSGSLTGSLVYPTQIAGFTPTAGSLGIIGFANAAAPVGFAEVYYHTKSDPVIPGPFDVIAAQAANIYAYAMGVLLDLGNYTGEPFSINTEDTANTLTHRIHELF